MTKLDFSVVEERNSLLVQQISNHPTFSVETVVREVVLERVDISAKEGYERGYFIDYYINHYVYGKLDKSFVKQTKRWVIDDELLITKRDMSTFAPISDPMYLDYVERNKLVKEITNPEYLSDKDFEKVPTNIPNPEYISEEETPYVNKEVPNPDYEDAVRRNNLDAKIPNPDYISDEVLANTSPYLMEPAFSYILGVMKEAPQLLFIVLSFYINEQDLDGFFNDYD